MGARESCRFNIERVVKERRARAGNSEAVLLEAKLRRDLTAVLEAIDRLIGGFVENQRK